MPLPPCHIRVQGYHPISVAVTALKLYLACWYREQLYYGSQNDFVKAVD